MGAHVPRRRCVGCGRIAPKSELLRVAAAPPSSSERAHAVADPLARMPGRGAYLCRDAGGARPAGDCLAQAERRGGIARALRRAIPGGLVLNDAKLVESVSP
ncbi:MAG TPA: YlxR family protein [Solirubrobacteraceae bacterium]|nr:YlxR family protein [Solirubrobacteraceae bacterium]